MPGAEAEVETPSRLPSAAGSLSASGPVSPSRPLSAFRPLSVFRPSRGSRGTTSIRPSPSTSVTVSARTQPVARRRLPCSSTASSPPITAPPSSRSAKPGTR